MTTSNYEFKDSFLSNKVVNFGKMTS